MRSLLLVFSFLFARSASFLCNQCGGEYYSGGLRPTAVECASGLVCLRAVVESPRKSFILSGCHEPEDGLIGCDFHNLPHNATIHRCVCLDQSCQSYFPNGNCSSSAAPVHAISHPNLSHQRKSYLLSSTTMTNRPQSTTSEPLIASSTKLIRNEFHYAERRNSIRAPNSGSSWQCWGLFLTILNVLFVSIH